jgi:hypothetical protein
LLLVIRAAFDVACSMVLTPTGRLIRRSVPSAERASVFAASFSLSHSWRLRAWPWPARVPALVERDRTGRDAAKPTADGSSDVPAVSAVLGTRNGSTF